MDASEYQQLAARTLLCEPDVVYTTQELMVVWNTMGVVGEIGEIQQLVLDSQNMDRDALIEELGDAWWYVAALCAKLNISLLWARLASMRAAALADEVKKMVFHRKPLQAAMLYPQLAGVVFHLLQLGMAYDVPLHVVFATNIEKLQRRFPQSGYTSEDANKRADKE